MDREGLEKLEMVLANTKSLFHQEVKLKPGQTQITKEQAQNLAWKIANAGFNSKYGFKAFCPIESVKPHLNKGKWYWSGLVGKGHSDISAKVSFKSDGSDQSFYTVRQIISPFPSGNFSEFDYKELRFIYLKK